MAKINILLEVESGDISTALVYLGITETYYTRMAVVDLLTADCKGMIESSLNTPETSFNRQTVMEYAEARKESREGETG